MKLEEVRTKAKSYSIKPVNLWHSNLLKMIQTDESNFDCFATAFGGICGQAECRLRDDCIHATQFHTAQEGALS